MSDNFSEKYNKFLDELNKANWRDRSTVVLKHLNMFKYAEKSDEVHVLVIDWSIQHTLETSF